MPSLQWIGPQPTQLASLTPVLDTKGRCVRPGWPCGLGREASFRLACHRYQTHVIQISRGNPFNCGFFEIGAARLMAKR